MLQDRFGRRITYLRISVTDRCNLRCVYCMPAEGITWQPHEAILRYEEIAQVVEAAARGGVSDVRITGGEPLVRGNLAALVAMLARIPGIEDISLTTNGILLENQVDALAAAGLKRINVSLDTLDAGKFQRITRGGSLDSVLAGIQAAEAAGLALIKINTVVMKGVNDDELEALAQLSLTRPWHIRFIEMMPVNNQQFWGSDFPDPAEMYYPIDRMLARLGKLGLQPANGRYPGSGPARMYRLPGASGLIGFISPIGHAFCDGCNRIRLTADGSLRPCLLSDTEVNIRDALRSGEDLMPYLQKAVDLKPVGHQLDHQVHPVNRCMMQIGG